MKNDCMRAFNVLINIFRFNNPFQILINRWIFGKIGPTIYRHSDLQFIVDHNVGDQDGPRACVEPGLYDPFFEVIKWNNTVNFLDLGANSGGFILGLLKNGKILNQGVAVELNPITWSRLIYNVYANVPCAAESLILINGAVAATDEKIKIRLGKGGVGDSISGEDTGDLYEIKCYTLDQLISQFNDDPIDIIKIDIEGSEYDLLSILPEVFQSVRYLLIEIHTQPNRHVSEVYDWIRNCGFREVQPLRKAIESNVYLFEKVSS